MRDELGWAVSGPVGGLAFSAANALAELDGPAGFKIDARLLFLVAFGAVLSVASVVMPLDRRGFFSIPGLVLRREPGFRGWSSPGTLSRCGTFPLGPFLIFRVFSRLRCSLTALSLCSSSILPP